MFVSLSEVLSLCDDVDRIVSLCVFIRSLNK